MLLSVPSYWDAHGRTKTTRNNTKRSLLRVQDQLFRIMTTGASLFLAFFVLMPHNPVFNYALTGFLFFFSSAGHLPQSVHKMGSVSSKKVVVPGSTYTLFTVCCSAPALKKNYCLGCCLWNLSPSHLDVLHIIYLVFTPQMCIIPTEGR